MGIIDIKLANHSSAHLYTSICKLEIALESNDRDSGNEKSKLKQPYTSRSE